MDTLKCYSQILLLVNIFLNIQGEQQVTTFNGSQCFLVCQDNWKMYEIAKSKPYFKGSEMS